ncbi:Uncharacterised protein [Mycobacteroides abscessus subsp. abscessus]|nr:Uncharacterised protein [Mycobacteroides abscessus subsp. abscessus]
MLGRLLSIGIRHDDMVIFSTRECLYPLSFRSGPFIHIFCNPLRTDK